MGVVIAVNAKVQPQTPSDLFPNAVKHPNWWCMAACEVDPVLYLSIYV